MASKPYNPDWIAKLRASPWLVEEGTRMKCIPQPFFTLLCNVAKAADASARRAPNDSDHETNEALEALRLAVER